MRDILALQMTDGPDTTTGEGDAPDSTFSITCTIEEKPD